MRSFFAFIGGCCMAALVLFVFFGRFELRIVGGSGGAFLLDRVTGSVVYCSPTNCDPLRATPNYFDQFDKPPGPSLSID